jgi:hypothetical protein
MPEGVGAPPVAVDPPTTPSAPVPKATTVTVTTVAQLIAEINNANAQLAPYNGANTIVLADGNYDLASVNHWWYGPTGLPPIRSDITIRNDGNGATIRRVSASPMRLFYVSGGNTAVGPPGAGVLRLINVTLSGGLARGGAGGANSGGGGGLGAGGAIYNQGSVELYRVTLTGNAAVGGAGGSDDGVANESAGGGGMGGDGASAIPGGGVFGRSAGGGGMGGNGGLLTGTSNGGSGGGGIAQSVRPGDTAVAGGPPTASTTGGVGGGSGGAGGNGGATGQPGALGGGGGGNGAGSTGPGGPGGIGGGAGGGNTDSIGGFGGGAGNCNASSRGGFGGASGSGGASPIGDLGFGGGGGGAVASGSQPGGYGGGSSTSNSYSGGGGAGLGGAIFNDAGTLTLANATLVGNSATGGAGGAAFSAGGAGGGAGFGGAIFNRSGNVVLTHVTIASNTVVGGLGTVAASSTDNGRAAGGAIYHLGINLGPIGARSTSASAAASLTIGNSVLANNIGGSDLETHNLATSFGGATVTLTYAGANIVETRNSVGTVTTTGAVPLAVDPQIQAALRSNGAPPGAPQTLFPVAASSPLINAGNAALVVDPPFNDSPVALDQRGAGFARIAGPGAAPNPDLGAVEVQYPVGIAIGGATPFGAACVPGAASRSYGVAYTNYASLAHSASLQATGSATANVSNTGAGPLVNVQLGSLDVPVRGTLGITIPAGVAANAGGSADVAAGGGGGASLAANATAFNIARTPTATIGAPSVSEICPGDSVDFPVAFADADAVSLTAAGVIVTGDSPTVQVSGTGVAARSISLSGVVAPVRIALLAGAATNLGCPSAPTAQSVEVPVLPTPNVVPQTPAAICSGGTTAITLASTPPGANFTWTAALGAGATTGFTAGSGPSINQTLAGAGRVDYTVSPTLTGCPGPPRVISQSVSAPVIATASLPDGGPGIAYDQTLLATGLLGNAVFSIASGALPNGLVLSPSGQITGTPTLAGQFTFSVQLADAGAPACTTGRNFTIRITDAVFADGFESP